MTPEQVFLTSLTMLATAIIGVLLLHERTPRLAIAWGVVWAAPPLLRLWITGVTG